VYKLSDRLKNLNQRLHEYDFSLPVHWYFNDVNILLDNKKYQALKKEPIAIRKAYSLQYIAEHLPVIIHADELVVGVPSYNSGEFGMCIPQYLTTAERKLFQQYGLSETSMFGHHPPSWNKIITYGVVGIRGEIEKELQGCLKNDSEKIIEYRAMLIALDALVIYAHRYATELMQKAQGCTNFIRKKELLQVADICRKVPLQPAESLQEAVQSYWFTYTILNSGGEFIPLGRLDQYFYRYYQEDIQSGRLTKAEAEDIIGSFLIKCNEGVRLEHKKTKKHCNIGFTAWSVTHLTENDIENLLTEDGAWHSSEDDNANNNYAFGQNANNKMMTCILGGENYLRQSEINEISYLILGLKSQMNLLFPTLGVRIGSNTPKVFLDYVSSILLINKGEPLIYNDESIIPGYISMGISREDASTYSSDGCWETLIPGKSEFIFQQPNLLKCLEWTLNRGIGIKSQQKESVDTGELLSFSTFEQLYQAYKQQMDVCMENMYNNFIRNYGISSLVAPDPLFSALVDDCIKNGKDIYNGGGKYRFRALIAAGLADTVDSLVAIRDVVYEKQRVTLEELNAALHMNWQGYERLRAYIINRVEKFGNDDDKSDCLAEHILHDYTTKLQELREKDCRIILVGGIGTFHFYPQFGREVAASANGRYSYEAIAPNYSPVPGFDKNGPTSVIKSITKPDLQELFVGTPVDISLNKTEFVGRSGIERLSSMIRSFCDLGGNIMSIAFNDIEEMKDAQIHPEKHKNLMVRMGGLSAYFISLAPQQQKNIIKRFERV